MKGSAFTNADIYTHPSRIVASMMIAVWNPDHAKTAHLFALGVVV